MLSYVIQPKRLSRMQQNNFLSMHGDITLFKEKETIDFSNFQGALCYS